MTEYDVRDGLALLTRDEPPLDLPLAPVLAHGRALRRRRRALAGTSAAALLAVGAVAIANHNPSQQDRLVIAPVAVTANAPSDRPLTPQQQRVADAIRASSPAGWTFAMAADRWDGVDAELAADDGTGPGRLMVGVSPAHGSQQLHPCRDGEFEAGATCTEQALADGSVLSLRDVVDWHGIRTVEVALTHPDGSGVTLESGNFTLDWPLPRVVTSDEKANLVHASRTDPTYPVAVLGQVALAIDRAIHG